MHQTYTLIASLMIYITISGCNGINYIDPYDGTFQANATIEDRGAVSSAVAFINDGVVFEKDQEIVSSRNAVVLPCHSNALTRSIQSVIQLITYQFAAASLEIKQGSYPQVRINGAEFFTGQTGQLNPSIYSQLDQISEALASHDDIKTTLLVNSPEETEIDLQRARHIERFLNARGVDPRLTAVYPDESEAEQWPASVTWLFCSVEHEKTKQKSSLF